MTLKIHISYPPLENNKGSPALAQNRQFQYLTQESYIYPVIPASAATLLDRNGYDVVWDDGIAEKITYDHWLSRLKESSPDIIFMESKTPVIKKHWNIINKLKEDIPDVKVILMGDHVSGMPQESFYNSSVDYVMEGGDYDFKGLELVDYLSGKSSKFPSGFYVRDEKNESKYTGKSMTNYSLNDLPMIDRELTKWRLYSEINGNYKYHPGTYTMVGRDCWYRAGGGCTFCSWTITYPKFMLESVDKALDEVGYLVKDLGVKEIFDDTGTFPAGIWLKKFCEGMIERGYNKEVKIGCNMRVGALNTDEYDLMKRAGFRFILYGIESANQKSLDMLNKGVTSKEQLDSIKKAAKAGLDPHITVMFGYPWETKEDAIKTLKLGTKMIKKQYAKTWQVTIVIPYPGTKLFQQCKENGWLLTENWEDYDMRRPVMKTPMKMTDIMEIIEKFYGAAYSPEFVARRVMKIKTREDLKYLFFGLKKVRGYRKNFSPDQIESEL